MRISSILATASTILGLASTVFATPHNDHDDPDKNPHARRHGCLTDHEADTTMKRWINFFTNFDPAIADKSVVDGFQLFSESSNYINPKFNHSELAKPQYASKAEFIAGQNGTSNPGVTIDQLFTVVASDHGCNSFTFRWAGHFFDGHGFTFSAPFPEQPVAGIDFVFLADDSYLIEKAYSEWNTAGFLQDIGCSPVGGLCTTRDCVNAGCGAAPKTPKRVLVEEGTKIRMGK